MKQENDWESLVCATLGEADEASDGIDRPLAQVAIERGTRRIAARASIRVAVVGAGSEAVSGGRRGRCAVTLKSGACVAGPR